MTEAWTRATTVASTLADRFGLEQWAKRNVAYGIGVRQDLYARAASTNPDDKKAFNDIVEQAEEAAKSRSGANLGTALHSWTERLDRGEEVAIPDPWRADLDAYTATLHTAGITVLPGYVERIVVIPQLHVAGTLDRIVTHPAWQLPRIGDVKTGADPLRYGAGDIAVQLALYAGATHIWKGSADEVPRDRWGRYLLPEPADAPDEYEPMLEVDRETAVVIHLPVGTGTCQLHSLDIAAGREAVRKAMWVREWRKRKNLSRPLEEGAQLTAAS